MNIEEREKHEKQMWIFHETAKQLMTRAAKDTNLMTSLKYAKHVDIGGEDEELQM